MLGAGTQLAGYRIEGVLGQGGMGVVYEATQLSIPRAVALKLLRHQDPEWEERFRREALTQATLDHPNVVPVYDAGFSEHGLYIAMRIVRGRTLKHAIRAGEVQPATAIALLAPIADALDAAHAAGIVHRDVKPQNILVGPRDHPYLTDFGIVRRVVDDEAITRTGVLLGTPDYVAPEQVLGDAATAASDVYSLACVLFECLTSTPPYPAPSSSAALYARLSGPPPRASTVREELPPALDDVLARGLARDPRDRPATAAALISEARRALDEPRPARRGMSRAGLRRRRRIGRVLAAVAAGAVLLAGAVALVRGDHDANPGPPPAVKLELLAATPGVTRDEFAARTGAHVARPAGLDAQDAGTLIRFRVTVRGYAGKRLVVRASMHDADTGALIGAEPIVIEIASRAQVVSEVTWLADGPRSTRAYVSLELFEASKTTKKSRPASAGVRGRALAVALSRTLTTEP